MPKKVKRNGGHDAGSKGASKKRRRGIPDESPGRRPRAASSPRESGEPVDDGSGEEPVSRLFATPMVGGHPVVPLSGDAENDATEQRERRLTGSADAPSITADTLASVTQDPAPAAGDECTIR